MNETIKIKPCGGGKFYKVNGDDAIIIHYLLQYKIRDYKVVIFPKEALSKISEELTKKRINYSILNEAIVKFTPNNYEYYKKEAYKKLEIEDRVNNIVKKIENLNDLEVYKFLDYIESYLL